MENAAGRKIALIVVEAQGNGSEGSGDLVFIISVNAERSGRNVRMANVATGKSMEVTGCLGASVILPRFSYLLKGWCVDDISV